MILHTTNCLKTGFTRRLLDADITYWQWCIAKNGGGYTQTGVAKGLKVPCLFMIAEVSIRCQKNPEVGIRRIPAYTPQYTTAYWTHQQCVKNDKPVATDCQENNVT